MSTGKDSAKVKMSKLVLLFYIFAALMGVMFIYMFIAGVMYINNYTASYGMSFTDMWADAVRYILSSSVSYLVFALVLLGIGKVLDTVQRGIMAKADESIQLKEELIIENKDSESVRQAVEEAEKIVEEVMEAEADAEEAEKETEQTENSGEDSSDEDEEQTEEDGEDENDKKESK